MRSITEGNMLLGRVYHQPGPLLDLARPAPETYRSSAAAPNVTAMSRPDNPAQVREQLEEAAFLALDTQVRDPERLTAVLADYVTKLSHRELQAVLDKDNQG